MPIPKFPHSQNTTKSNKINKWTISPAAVHLSFASHENAEQQSPTKKKQTGRFSLRYVLLHKTFAHTHFYYIFCLDIILFYFGKEWVPRIPLHPIGKRCDLCWCVVVMTGVALHYSQTLACLFFFGQCSSAVAGQCSMRYSRRKHSLPLLSVATWPVRLQPTRCVCSRDIHKYVFVSVLLCVHV